MKTPEPAHEKKATTRKSDPYIPVEATLAKARELVEDLAYRADSGADLPEEVFEQFYALKEELPELTLLLTDFGQRLGGDHRHDLCEELEELLEPFEAMLDDAEELVGVARRKADELFEDRDPDEELVFEVHCEADNLSAAIKDLRKLLPVS
jgi:hypothetical protein